MLHLYYGKDTQDAYAFFFARIREQKTKSYVICPEQFTHTVELQAIEALGGKGMMDTEVLSFSRLGHKILERPAATSTRPFPGTAERCSLQKLWRRKKTTCNCLDA